MLQGLPEGCQPEHLQPYADSAPPEIVFEDNHILVVNKPAGLLSVPGLATTALHPDMPELQLVHRLDQSTSGLLLLAKTRLDHKLLQKQFTERTIKKQYVALLDGVVDGDQGEISLPLRVDLDNRPRQMVCRAHGKAALTQWELLSWEGPYTRVAMYPVTGRTHQLRMHAAHREGLGLPMLGDELYGRSGKRLHLHAHTLCLSHPRTRERMTFQTPVPF